jgi:hypothetical protein
MYGASVWDAEDNMWNEWFLIALQCGMPRTTRGCGLNGGKIRKRLGKVMDIRQREVVQRKLLLVQRTVLLVGQAEKWRRMF